VDLGLKDHVIPVTGGGSWIGEAITRACLEEDASVAVVGRFSEDVKHFQNEIQQCGRPCSFFERSSEKSCEGSSADHREIPLGHRMTDAAEIAAMVVFLLSSKQSGHTKVQHIVVDGWYTHLDRMLT
jgi:NAD(P)-dependent dehydrogenase (short-subunit alcohol dehydrogenase family)